MNSHEKEQRREQLEAQLMNFHEQLMPLPGIAHMGNMLSFIEQLIDSLHRIEYVRIIRRRPISPARIDPRSQMFDPIRAAALVSKESPEEAFWLVFLATHCGKNLKTEWLLARELYGANEETSWTWERVSGDPESYGDWIRNNQEKFSGKFGNHRKYESLKPGPRGTARAVSTYAAWIKEFGSHTLLIAHALAQSQGDQRKAFSLLYEEMGVVVRFGRTARFDYLTMLAKLGLAAIDADSTYMNEATGPKRGARLLFDGQIDSNTGSRELERRVALLEHHLGVGMQVMEDSLCNWQKSPNQYVQFRG